MTELSLIFAIVLAGLATAGVLSRWVGRHDAGGSSARRLAAALLRATEALLWQQARVIATVTAAVVGLVVLVHFAMGRISDRPSDLVVTVAAALGVVTGAAAAWSVAWSSAVMALRATVRTDRAAGTSIDRGFTLALRSGGVSGLVTDCLSLLGVAALFGLAYSMKGGFASGAEPVPLRQVACLLPGYALGAAAAALVIQSAGARYETASSVGGDGAPGRGSGLSHGDPRSPAAIADVVGDHVGRTVGRAVDGFVTSTAASILAVAAGVAVVDAAGPSAANPLAIVLFPLVVRAFGILATAFGVQAVHLGPRDSAAVAVLRGRLTTATIALGGVAGASIWLLGALWPTFTLAGALGLVAGLVASSTTGFRADRSAAPVRAVLDGVRSGAPTAVAQGFGAGLQSSLLPLLVYGLATGTAWALGQSTGLAHGGLLAVATSLTATLSETGFVLAAGAFTTVTRGAGSVARLDGSDPEHDGALVRRLDDGGLAIAAASEKYLGVSGLAMALLTAAALPLLAGSGAKLVTTSLDLGLPTVVWCATLGGTAVAFYAGRALRQAAEATMAVALDVERQLRGFARDGGIVTIPPDFAPSYRSSTDMAARGALAHLGPAAALAVGVPVALALGLSTLGSAHGTPVASSGLASFVLSASVVGAVIGFAGDATRSVVASARRALGRSGGPGQAVIADTDAIGALVSASAGGAAQTLARTFAVTAMALAPYLS